MGNPIRILHVVTYMGRGGLETMVMNYYRHIDRSKIQFDFLVHRDFEADYDQEIVSLGGKIFRLPRLVPWSRSYQKALDQFFESHPEYRIVHVHQDCLSSVILKAAKKYGVPVRIAHSHSSSQDKNLKYPIKMYYMKKIPQYATDLFACGKVAGDWMFRGSGYTVLNNAIDAQAYCPDMKKRAEIRKQLGIDDSCFVAGHVGRYQPAKNHKYLIEIFSQLHQLRPSSKLLLVGDGNGRPAVEAFVKELHLEHSVIMTGIRNDVPNLMQAMDVFVFPSLYEGFGMVALEAQAAGLPCFISDKVPLECKITKNVYQISLSEQPAQWAAQIAVVQGHPRTNRYDDIVNAGFDIKSNAQWLQNYYLKQWEENS